MMVLYKCDFRPFPLLFLLLLSRFGICVSGDVECFLPLPLLLLPTSPHFVGRSGCSISIHPPFLVKTTFCPTAAAPNFSLLSFSSCTLSDRVPLVLDLELAGHGKMVLALNETVRMDAAKVAMKKEDVARRFVRKDGFVRRDHIV